MKAKRDAKYHSKTQVFQIHSNLVQLTFASVPFIWTHFWIIWARWKIRQNRSQAIENSKLDLINVWKLKSSKSTQTWYNLHLDQYLSFEPNFDSFGLDEKFVKIEAKQSWNWSVMLKIVWKLKSSKSTQTWYNLHLHQYLSFEPNFGSFGLDEKFIKLEAKQSWNDAWPN